MRLWGSISICQTFLNFWGRAEPLDSCQIYRRPPRDRPKLRETFGGFWIVFKTFPPNAPSKEDTTAALDLPMIYPGLYIISGSSTSHVTIQPRNWRSLIDIASPASFPITTGCWHSPSRSRTPQNETITRRIFLTSARPRDSELLAMAGKHLNTEDLRLANGRHWQLWGRTNVALRPGEFLWAWQPILDILAMITGQRSEIGSENQAFLGTTFRVFFMLWKTSLRGCFFFLAGWFERSGSTHPPSRSCERQFRCFGGLARKFWLKQMNHPWSLVAILVAINGGTPKSSFFVGFSLTNHPFWGNPMYGPQHFLRSLRTTASAHQSFPVCGFDSSLVALPLAVCWFNAHGMVR